MSKIPYTKQPLSYSDQIQQLKKRGLRIENEPQSASMPPSWMMFEFSSFGILSSLYSNLLPGKGRRDIANYFGLSDSVLESWLHSIVYLRNICAHHSRLWNKEMRIQPIIPRNPRNQFIIQT